MHILITGASGFIASHLIPALCGEGMRITALTRNAKRLRSIHGDSIEIIESLDAIESDTPIDAIINLAGANISKRWTPRHKKEILESRINTTRNLCALVARLKTPPATVISASAIGYYGSHDGDTGLDEDASPRPGFTHDLCMAWEGEAMRMEEPGARVFIIRLGVVLGKGGGILEEVLPMFRFGLGGRLGSGGQYLSWVHMDDVIGAVLFLLKSESRGGERQGGEAARERPKTKPPASRNKIDGGAYNLTAPHPVTNAEWTETLAQTLARPAFMHLPAPVVGLMFGEMGRVLLLKGQRVLPARLIQEGYNFKYAGLPEALGDILAK